MAARNDGAELEELVALVESALAPSGFTLERQPVERSEDGAPLAEFDIVIGGKVGSAPVSLLIECRDRPSQGPAPGAWIEQLAGRRERFGFAKVMAVSSSSFSESAREAAERLRVELRVVGNFDREDLLKWLPPSAPLIHVRSELKRVEVALTTRGDNEESVGDIGFLPWSEKRLTDRQTGETASLQDAWAMLKAKGATKGQGEPPPGGDEFVIDGIERLGVEYTIDCDQRLYDVAHIYFTVGRTRGVPIPLVKSVEYRSDGAEAAIAQVGHYQGSAHDPIESITVIGFRKTE